jgi:hypothetical protein
MTADNGVEYCSARYGTLGKHWRIMRTRINRGARLALGATAAVSLLAFALTAAMAQNWNNSGGGTHQSQGQSWHNGKGNTGDSGGYRQDRTGNHGNQWGERQSSGAIVYHQQPSYYYHPYRGTEHRRYYTYGGSEFYVNTDTGIRVEISL